MKRFVIVAAACAVAACGSSNRSGSDETAQQRASATPRKPSYCFFKNEETKSWTASVDGTGNVIVSGKAHVKDPRYRPELGKARIDGARAIIAPSISPNVGYASPDNWWDLTATVPDSGTVTSVKIECGPKTLAELSVKRGG